MRRRQTGGFSLVELVIAAGVIGFLSLLFLNFVTSLQNQMRALNQKNETLEVVKSVRQMMDNMSSCSFNLLTGLPATMDLSTTTTTVPSPTVINIPVLRFGAAPTASVIAQQAQILPGSHTGLRVNTITFDNIRATGNPNEYVGRLSVSFDPATTAIPFQNLEFQQIFNVNPSPPALPTARSIVSCGSATNSSIVFTAYNFDPTTIAPIVIPANRCAHGIEVSVQMDGMRNDIGGGSGYRGRFLEFKINGLTEPALTLEFGSAKGGSSGHGWWYKVAGISKRFIITNVTAANTIIPFEADVPAISNVALTNRDIMIRCL
ncbi:MAG: type II secretion system protein J [Bdellovibrionales bacterium]